MGRIGDWVNRQRHNKGYGVQSPSEFFFVTQVLKERLPYYAYPLLEDIAKRNSLRARYLKELFRITNHYKPSNCLAIESPAAACAMTTARPSVQVYSISGEKPEETTDTLLTNLGCNVLQGETSELLKRLLEEEKSIGMLYIGRCRNQAELLGIAIRYTNESSIIVIEGIQRDAETRDWWRTIIESDSTIITYDMCSYGFLLFNKERRKQHYTLKR